MWQGFSAGGGDGGIPFGVQGEKDLKLTRFAIYAHYAKIEHTQKVKSAMNTPTPQKQTAVLFNQVAEIGAEDQNALQAISFRAQGIARRIPSDPYARTANAAILICSGHLDRGKEELESAWALLPNAGLPVRDMAASLLYFTGQYDRSCELYRKILGTMGEDLRHPDMKMFGWKATQCAVLAGDIELLESCAAITQDDTATAFMKVINALGLSDYLNAHQSALNGVLANYQARSEATIHCDPEGSLPSIVMRYFIPENLYDGRRLRRDVFDAVEAAEHAINVEPGYFSRYIAVDILPMFVVGHIQAA